MFRRIFQKIQEQKEEESAEGSLARETSTFCILSGRLDEDGVISLGKVKGFRGVLPGEKVSLAHDVQKDRVITPLRNVTGANSTSGCLFRSQIIPAHVCIYALAPNATLLFDLY